MRGLRVVILTALAISLLAGSAAGVAAQREVDGPLAASVFSWAVVDVLEGGVLVIEAVDPRASGSIHSGDPSAHVDGAMDDPFTGIGYDTVRLTNEGGAWVGTRTHLFLDTFSDPPIHQALDVWQLTGAEGYEGLSLRLVDERRDDGGPVWGIIFPTEAITPARQPAGDRPSSPPATAHRIAAFVFPSVHVSMTDRWCPQGLRSRDVPRSVRGSPGG